MPTSSGFTAFADSRPPAEVVAHNVYERLRGRYELQPRGMVEVRGKGPTTTYLLLGHG